jgi:hypothetical protein
MPSQPSWNAAAPVESLHAFAKWLQNEAREVFAKDGTHAHLLFLIDKEQGLVSMNPIPPNTNKEQISAGVRQAIEEHDIYAVVSVAESWVYYPNGPRDHTAIQLRYNEMGVADLRDEDRREALLVRMESSDGELLTWFSPIVRNKDSVRLGSGVVLPREKCLGQDGFF